MKLRRNHSPAIAGAKAGFSTATAYRFEKTPDFPARRRRAGNGGAPIPWPTSGTAKSSRC